MTRNNVKINVKDTQRPVCGRCKSGYVYVTKRGIVCRRCGHITQTVKTGPGAGREAQRKINNIIK